METKKQTSHDSALQQDKILLLLLPYWTPLVPPQGIAHLKTYLQHHGYRVQTYDANTGEEFKRLYNEYFVVLRDNVSLYHRGNFYNIGHDVMRNHMMAHIHRDAGNDREYHEYRELVATIVQQTFFTDLEENELSRLIDVVERFYVALQRYISDLLSANKPQWFGLSVMRDTIGPSLFAFRLAKEMYPGIKTVMGGSIFSDHLRLDSPNFKSFLERTPYIDHLIIGEGQGLLLKLLQGHLPAGQRVFTLAADGAKPLGFSPENTPDLSDFDVGVDYPYLSAQASASCPNQCSFCNVLSFYGPYREKDPQQTVDEMTRLYDAYGLQVFYMNDALLNLVATPLANAFIKNRVLLYWDGYLRVDKPVCDPDNTYLWRRGGMYRVRLGIESGSQHVLDMMDKGITPAQTAAALRSLAEAGIKTTAYWVIGHPGETEEDFLMTLDLLEQCKDDIYQAECNPFIFGYSGQGSSDAWENRRKLLYPAGSEKMLLLQTWIVDGEPSRQEAYERVYRFVERCRQLGIPNPYSLQEIYEADKRWQRLHANAVPGLTEFRDSIEKGILVNDTHQVKKRQLLENRVMEEEGDFDF